MTWQKPVALIACVVSLLAFTRPARADQWNDRTTLKFDTPIMVPGATLAPGTYTFKLLNSKANRGIVQIFNEDMTKLYATTQTVPIRRLEATGDIVVKVNPTGAGAPAALKAWYYPGSLHGHEFIYPDREARDIAQRTKTVVLSTDVPDSDMQEGTLYVYDGSGNRQPWQGDAATLKEWQEWNDQRTHTATARVAEPGGESRQDSTAPMVRSNSNAMTVPVGDLEEHPNRYVGKQIAVTGQVDDVFGPRLFKIDEPNWADLDREVLVYVPADFAALVRSNDRVTVTGTMKTIGSTEVARQIDWLRPDADASARLVSRPVLVASKIVGGNSDVALLISTSSEQGNGATDRNASTGDGSKQAESAQANAGNGGQPAAVGTTGTDSSSASNAITKVSMLANGDRDLVGRRVVLNSTQVIKTSGDQGFWVGTNGGSVFVRPAKDKPEGQQPSVGQSVNVEGIVLQMPKALQPDAVTNHGNEQIYISATKVR